MTPYMKTIFQQKKKTEILTKISGSAPLIRNNIKVLSSVTIYRLIQWLTVPLSRLERNIFRYPEIFLAWKRLASHYGLASHSTTDGIFSSMWPKDANFNTILRGKNNFRTCSSKEISWCRKKFLDPKKKN